MRRLPERAGYETLDGRFRVVPGFIPEMCANPHPGCPGDQFHDRPGWLVEEITRHGEHAQIGWERPFAATKREAVALIEWRLNTEK